MQEEKESQHFLVRKQLMGLFNSCFNYSVNYRLHVKIHRSNKVNLCKVSFMQISLEAAINLKRYAETLKNFDSHLDVCFLILKR